MILTGHEIEKEHANGRITIAPFSASQVNPNSYNFRLGRTLRVYRSGVLDPKHLQEFDEIEIPDEGLILQSRRLYLAHTIEVLGSDHYVPTFAARSSIARLGIFIHLSSGLGDIGYKGQWTLQLYTLNDVRVYPGMNIGQMMWWRPEGEVVLYDGKYQGASGPRHRRLAARPGERPQRDDDISFIALACVVKASSVYLGARVSGESSRRAVNLAVALNARGGPGIVLASVTYDAGIINGQFFTTLVLTAVITSLMAGSWLERSLRRGQLLDHEAGS